MKTQNNFLALTLVLIISSCAAVARFPVSSIAPAAEIIAKKKKDENKNFVIEVTAKYLASADRLNPPKNNYVVWILTKDNGTKNIGQLTNVNGRTSYLKAITPFIVKEIFITAEEQGNISEPSGTEVSRTTF